MRRLRLTILLCLCAAPLAAQQTGVRPDTLVAPADTVPAAEFPVRMGLKTLASPFHIELPASPASGLLWLTPRYLDLSVSWRQGADQRLEAARRELWLSTRFPAAAPPTVAEGEPPPADSLAWLPEPPRREQPVERREFLPGVMGEYTDVWMSIQGRGEMGGSWQRFRPCDGLSQLSCEPNLFPQLRPDIQFGVQVGGTISERVHLNVDYDQRREFDAANNINIYYQGQEDEILRRLEVGDVSIRLPQSRYITQNIPAGNFGFRAEGQLGPLDFQTVWAQQKGDVATHSFRLGGGASGSLDQERRLVVDDAEYARGQFFFLVHPDSLAGAPHVNVLNLASGPPHLTNRTGGVVEVYRDERLSAHQLTGSVEHFRARAVAYDEQGDSVEVSSNSFRRLNDDEYVLHRSGTWLVLRTPLRNEEALAVSFITGSGDVIGTPDAQTVARQGEVPRLQLVRAPVSGELHRPDRPTWPLELKNIYRLDGSAGVLPRSVQLAISIGDAQGGVSHKDYQGEQITLLKLFGLDETSPFEQVDDAQIHQPQVLGTGQAIPFGTFVVFPTLLPFAAPPPVATLGLSAEQTREILGHDANATIYEDPDPFVRAAAARFRLTFNYSVRLEGLVSSFNLGGIAVREGSERISVDGSVLERNVDYTIDYDIGLVTLRDPQAIFARPDAVIQATYEQHTLFDISPTGVFGLNARYQLGRFGQLDFIGLHQRERSVMARPQLGQEPGSILMTGVSGQVGFGGAAIDRALARVPGLRTSGGSSLTVRGDVALSSPNPNTRGSVYLDDFEGSDEVPLALERRFWRLGSRPQDPAGAVGVLPAELSVQSAASMVWQEVFMTADGRVGGALPPEYIDRNLLLAGRGLLESVLWFSFGDSTAPAGTPLWRSLTTPLSTTGRDLSRAEYLEFYAFTQPGETFSLVIDVGTVSEDAFYFDQDGNLSGVDSLGRPWGLGVLDEEAPVEEGGWSMQADQRGLWDQRCRAEPGVIYPVRDPRMNCTRGNGLPDTEDLNGNGMLDANDGPYFRWVVRLDETSPYFVRETGGGEFQGRVRLYRIPLRGAGGTAVNATDATWRSVQHLRMTVVGEVNPTRVASGHADFALSRMRIVGSRWTKRETHGVFSGRVSPATGASAGSATFTIGEASALTHGGDYASPPGVLEQLQDPSLGFGGGGQQFNEKSLRLAYADLGAGERAEVHFRYPQQPRSMLTYRQVRLWAVARQGNWGPAGDQELIVRLGTDHRNHYLFRTPLNASVGSQVRAGDWLPEVVIDFERFFELKARAEEQLLTEPPPQGELLVLWSADSIYGIVLEDRARAPNLAAVRELAFGIYNAAGVAASGEIWINDLRLADGVRDPGAAGSLDITLRASDLFNATVQLANQGAMFRQLNQEASYRTTGSANLSATLNAGRLAPAAWAIDLPVTVSHNRSALDPYFLDQSDLRADRLTGLRETGAQSTRINATLRRTRPTSNPLLGLLLDGTSLRLGYMTSEQSQMTSSSRSDQLTGGISYGRQLRRREFGLIPGFVETGLRAITPARVEQSDAFRRLINARFRWSPESVSFSSSYLSQESQNWRYDRIIALPGDSAVRPTSAPRQGLDSNLRVALRPLGSLEGSVTLTTTRDLLDPEKAAFQEREREAVAGERVRLAGMDLGWETGRTVNSNISYAPEITRWLRPRVSFNSSFRMDRRASYATRIAQGADSVAVLRSDFGGNRSLTRSLAIEPLGLTRALLGTPEGDDGRLRRVVHGVGARVEAIDVSWGSQLLSQFQRDIATPGAGYQLGFGGLDDFRFIDGDTAAVSRTGSTFRAASGVRLPFGTQLRAEYAAGLSESFDVQGGSRQDRNVTWPRLNLTWRAPSIPAPLGRFVRSFGMTAGYVGEQRTGTMAGESSTLETHESVSLPLSFNVGLPGGLNAQYSRSSSARNSDVLNGVTEDNAVTHRASVSGAFRPPGARGERMQNPIQTSLQYDYQAGQRCRFAPAGALNQGCVPNNDFLTRAFSLTLDTMIQALNVGAQVSYTDRQNFVGTRAGSSQFQLNIFGQFLVQVGDARGGR
jgi:hypothetical protein